MRQVGHVMTNELTFCQVRRDSVVFIYPNRPLGRICLGLLFPACFLTAFVRLPTSAQPLHLAVARYAFDEMSAHLPDNRTKSVKDANDRFRINLEKCCCHVIAEWKKIVIFANKYYRIMKHADYIEQIEIDSLWSGKRHVVWNLDRRVNVLSGINGVGKSTIINKVVKSIEADGNIANPTLKGVHIKTSPEDATHIRFDVIRSFDRPIVNGDMTSRMDHGLATELDLQLYKLQRKYLDYQVNMGNRIIEALHHGDTQAAHAISEPKKKFQDIIDELFRETAKKIVRTENEIRFSQIGETLLPYQLSSGEKQMLVILLTVLVEDKLPYILFMDEPEVSLHVDWQERLISIILEMNPNVQVILTTHSPAVIMNGWMGHVTEVNDILIDT